VPDDRHSKRFKFVPLTHEGAPAATVTAEQLSEAKTLYAVYLDDDLRKEVNERCPHLLEETKKEETIAP